MDQINSTIVDYYEVLGVPRRATAEQLKGAYRHKILQYHPDRHDEVNRPMAEQVFHLLNAAYAVLRSPETRALYDQQLDAHARPKRSTDPTQVLEQLCDPKLKGLPERLKPAVAAALAEVPNEQVIACWRASQKPSHVANRRSLLAGAVVLTTKRVLLPFVTQAFAHGHSQEHAPEVPSVFWTTINRIELLSSDRLSNVTWLRFQTDMGPIDIPVAEHNLVKLLLIAGVHRIPIHASYRAQRRRDRVLHVFVPWLLLFAIALGLAGFWLFLWLTLGGFSLGPLDEMTGVWAWLLLATSLWSGARAARWHIAYSTTNLTDAIRREAGGRGT